MIVRSHEENDVATITLSSRACELSPRTVRASFGPQALRKHFLFYLFHVFFHRCRSRDFIREMILKAPKNGIPACAARKYNAGTTGAVFGTTI